MAYLNILVSVPPARLDAFRREPFACSHLVAYWVKLQPLGAILGEALDGGQPLHAGLRHPFREPVWHDVEQTRSLAARLSGAWTEARQGATTVESVEWFVRAIGAVVDLFADAAEHGECVVSILEGTTLGPEVAVAAREAATP